MGRAFIFSFLFILIAQSGLTDIPKTMSYQGLLTDASGKPLDGNYSLTFRLYNTELGGAALWTETHSSVAVVKGIFNVILGSSAPEGSLTLPFDQQYWMGIQVGVGTELTPRVKLTSSPYSLNAQSVADSAVTAGKLANNAVTVDKIQPNVVSSVDGVSNDGGNIDLVQQNAITITPNDAANTITIGENHSTNTSNPHNTTAVQTGALVSVEEVSNPGGNIDLVPGSNIVINHDDDADTITISSNSWGLNGNTGTNPGSNFLGTINNVALELKVNSFRALRLEPTTTSINIIGGYYENSITSGVSGSNINGGGAYGRLNLVTDNFGTVGGGLDNQAGNNAGTIEDGTCATVGGGTGNNAEGYASTIPGGAGNIAKGQYSFAAGHHAMANHNGSFVWGDSTHADVASTVDDQFVVRANGGIQFRDSREMRMSDTGDAMLVLEADTNNSGESDNPGILLIQDGGAVEGFLGYAEGTNNLLLENRYSNGQLILKSSKGMYLYTNDAETAGVYLKPGGSGWNAVSDRDMKGNIREVDVKEVLNRLAKVPISQWSYKTQDPSIEHIGPMAQDFREAFGLGEDDRSINSIDADGVALAAIQGLYKLVREKEAENAALRQQVDNLAARLAALERLVTTAKGWNLPIPLIR